MGQPVVPAPPKFYLSLLIHAHQPCGNFEHVLERSYERSYLPFIQLLEEHPKVHLGLHYSGPLLVWIEKNRPEYFARLLNLVRSGRVEMVGGGFYEPILVSIPPEDQREQVLKLADYVEKHFAHRPTGAWLAERVWEPQLPSALAAASVAYTLVDDIHFLSAGFEPEELFGAYIAEDRGQSVWVFPGQKKLRYLIPFGRIEDLVAYLRESALAHPGGVAAMGDDMEKFGVWPGTYEHCFGDLWLKKFFTALEENQDWLAVVTPSEYMATHAPLGRADLPTASYPEMMEWALPAQVRKRYEAVQKEFSTRPEVSSFLRGGPWRAFFRKYAESNLLHKKMLRTSARIAAVPPRRNDPKAAAEMVQARDLLMRAQCNDAYWHGIFGGLYAPHLRTELWRSLIRAETIADRHMPGGLAARVEFHDYDADGANELVFSAPEYQAMLKPADGGTLAVLDFRPVAATLVNSIMRRPEAYHARLGASGKTATGEVSSIHEQTRAKEPGLEKYLKYDRWLRHAFRVMIFDPKKNHTDYEALQLEEDAGFAGAEYKVQNSAAHETELEREGALSTGTGALLITKRYSFWPAPRGCEVALELGVKLKEVLSSPVVVGVESILNFLAPSEPDRFFESPSGPVNLRFSGMLPGPILRLEDGWQRLRIALHAPGSEEFWIAPVETVSESEAGFERVYQGSQILAVWKPALTAQRAWSARLVWRVEAF